MNDTHYIITEINKLAGCGVFNTWGDIPVQCGMSYVAFTVMTTLISLKRSRQDIIGSVEKD